MQITKTACHIAFVISITDFVITGNSVTAIVALGTACINLGILIGEGSRK